MAAPCWVKYAPESEEGPILLLRCMKWKSDHLPLLNAASKLPGPFGHFFIFFIFPSARFPAQT